MIVFEISAASRILAELINFESSKKIMEDVNKEFGLASSANGIIFAVPTEKAYKI